MFQFIFKPKRYVRFLARFFFYYSMNRFLKVNAKTILKSNHHVNDFMEKFTDNLTKVSRSDKCCYLTGDFNLDLLRYADHEPTQKFIDCLFSHMFVPLIDRPTHITAHSATLIDNIFANHYLLRLN